MDSKQEIGLPRSFCNKIPPNYSIEFQEGEVTHASDAVHRIVVVVRSGELGPVRPYNIREPGSCQRDSYGAGDAGREESHCAGVYLSSRQPEPVITGEKQLQSSIRTAAGESRLPSFAAQQLQRARWIRVVRPGHQSLDQASAQSSGSRHGFAPGAQGRRAASGVLSECRGERTACLPGTGKDLPLPRGIGQPAEGRRSRDDGFASRRGIPRVDVCGSGNNGRTPTTKKCCPRSF